jgi:putative PIN family toxin of toxin-antitoxin system
MRVVIDTNVFVSGIFWKGPPFTILDAWRDGRFEIVLSPAILMEYQRVTEELQRSRPPIDLRGIIRLAATSSHMVADVQLPEPVCSDPADDKFLAAAVAGKARVVISGDKALLAVKRYGNVQVTTPHSFVKTWLRAK